ncbi:hypothetical protein K438DRAFT_1988581 [Mycena galopus ATCC 62051]|nr:hypothetical protein K438DRAFT_1988581 [Mycena galopus ATCC 62051]
MYAVWDIAVTTPSKDASGLVHDDINGRRDANPARLRKFRRVLAAAFKVYFGRSEQHLHLASIAMHPVPALLKTYDNLAFDTLGTETVQVEGKEDVLRAGEQAG